MKKTILFTMLLSLMASTHSFARQGEHDNDSHDDGRTIECRQFPGGEVVLSFSTVEGQGSALSDLFELSVKARGDDIGEMFIKDLRSGDTVKAKRLEELLKVTLTSAEDEANSQVTEVPTHKGQGELELINPKTHDSSKVKSLSRRGEGRMEVQLQTAENPDAPIEFKCEKLR